MFLGNLIEWLRQVKEVTVSFSGINLQADAIRYLDDCGFFASHNGGHLNPNAARRGTTMPYTQVAQPNSHAWLDGTFVPWLSNRLNQSAATLAPLRICAAELLNNIADHTRYDIGGVAAQHFPNKDRLEIAVADFGRGIVQSVQSVRAGLADGDAIELATQEGFTTQSTPRNRGAGLDYLLRVVPGNCLGTISIYSARAIVTFAPRTGGGLQVTKSLANGFCPGTFIRIDIDTKRIQPADEEEDLQW